MTMEMAAVRLPARHVPPCPARAEWAYFLDMDGTLIELADAPDAARTDACIVDLIGRLLVATRGAVAIVSGRALADLDRRFHGLKLPLAGQHGLERRDAAGRQRRHGTPAALRRSLEARLKPVVERHPGLLLEDKGATLAVHYRQAPQLASYVHRFVHELVRAQARAEPAQAARLELQKGKRVVEIKPAGFHKGTAIEAFLREPPFCGRKPVYIGDDLTDEHGFAVVNRHGGLSIKVGRGPSTARYRLPDVAAVRSWLASALPAAQQG